MLSEVFAGVRQKIRDFAIGRKFTLGVEGDFNGADRYSKLADAVTTEADAQRQIDENIQTLLDDVVHVAKKFEYTNFDDDPQAAIEKALQHTGETVDMNGDAITLERVMAHLGLEYVEPELNEALTV